MKVLFHFFSIVLLMALFSFVGYSQTLIKGTIKDENGKPVLYANIYVKLAKVGGVSSETGEFSFSVGTTGQDTLIVSSLGYQKLKQPILISGNEMVLNIVMNFPVKMMEEVVISAGLIEASNERSVAVLKPLDIVTTAGGQGDIVGAIQTLPGVQRNGGDQTGLMVRGGDVNESSMIIDGMIAQNAFQSSVPGVSQRSRFNPFQFKGTSFSSGGYTARYGQALSAVLDLQTNDLPEKSNLNVGANMAGISVSGTKLMEKNAIEYSGSYQNLAPFYGVTPTNVTFYKVPEGGTFSTRWISKLDNDKGLFKMNFSKSFTKSGIEINNPMVPGTKLNYNLANENTYFNTSFSYAASSKLSCFTAFSFSNNIDNIGFGPFAIYKNDSRAQARAEMRYEVNKKVNFLLGSEVQRISYLQTDSLTWKFDETISAGYMEGEFKLGRKFAFKPGVRGEYSQLLAKGNVAPRLSFAVRTGKNTQLSFAGGMFYQSAAVNYLLHGYRPDFQKSIHYMLNYQYMKKGRVFRLEGYYKDYQQLIREKGYTYTPNPFRKLSIIDNTGSGYAQGVDVFWRDKESVKNLDYWISYSYIDTKRLYQNYVSNATPDYVSKHNLNVIVKYMVEKINTNFSFSYNYSSGRPYYNPTSPIFLSDHVKDYQNLAMTASYLRTFKKVFAVFYVSLDNMLNTKNVLGYRYSADGKNNYPIVPPMYRSLFVGMNFSFTQFNQDDL
jgi:hypothetical protein